MLNNMSTAHLKTPFISDTQKQLEEAGIMYDTGKITPDGQSLLLAWLLKANIKAFTNDVVEPIINDKSVVE